MTMLIYDSFYFLLKGLRTDLSSNLIFLFPFLMFKMVNIGNFNALSKLESQILRHKQDTEFEILCFVNEARV